MRSARTGADELEGAPMEVGPVRTADAGQTELPGQSSGLELDGGHDQDAYHAPLDGAGSEPFSGCCVVFADSLARSHAA